MPTRDSTRLLLLASCITLPLTAGCQVGGSREFSVVPGPAVPSPTPTSPPYVWDTREELDIWINNAVTRVPNPLSIVGEGREAFIRIELISSRQWVLRGPDLTSPARAVRGLHIWYRWQRDPNLPPNATQTLSLRASFDAVNPPSLPRQPAAYAQLKRATDWTVADFRPGSFRDPLDVNYVYLDDQFYPFYSNAGVLEIDRIELVQ